MTNSLHSSRRQQQAPSKHCKKAQLEEEHDDDAISATQDETQVSLLWERSLANLQNLQDQVLDRECDDNDDEELLRLVPFVSLDLSQPSTNNDNNMWSAENDDDNKTPGQESFDTTTKPLQDEDLWWGAAHDATVGLGIPSVASVESLQDLDLDDEHEGLEDMEASLVDGRRQGKTTLRRRRTLYY